MKYEKNLRQKLIYTNFLNYKLIFLYILYILIKLNKIK